MAKEQTNLRLAPSTIDKLDMLVTMMRKQTGLSTSRATIITVLVEEAAARVEAQAQPLKRIEPIRDGKKTIGWQAVYGDHIVGTFDLRDKDRAQSALDRFVYEELSR